uniref:AlNc14C469G11823 protein n=1 Tax=Albugo laibachii Nc14 TaxID=890382 RepID=F0X085_9STRA|nr:AlNc14C469G11823 [Albugo laibachii Nc14]|eukprot:CCA27167.1 AlNc14C469G11823 [Albugo laibachii Nc14]
MNASSTIFDVSNSLFLPLAYLDFKNANEILIELEKNNEALERSHKEDTKRLRSKIQEIANKVLSANRGELSTPAQSGDRGTSSSPNQKAIMDDVRSAASSGSFNRPETSDKEKSYSKSNPTLKKHDEGHPPAVATAHSTHQSRL